MYEEPLRVCNLGPIHLFRTFSTALNTFVTSGKSSTAHYSFMSFVL